MRRTDQSGELPDVRDLLGDAWDDKWDYQYILPTSLPKLARFGFVPVHAPINFIYGAQLVLVGRPRRDILPIPTPLGGTHT